MPTRIQYRIGVDIGGTFTDIVLYNDCGETIVSKVSSTPEDPGLAVVEGVTALVKEHGIAPSDISEVVHGTTVGSNTILQKVGARTGLITTHGFRDVLEIGRIRTPDMFDLTWEKPEQLVERCHRLGVPERLSATGEIILPLDVDALRSAMQQLVDDGCDAVAICFLNSYANPIHEIIARDLVLAEFPELSVTASCDVLPEMKEYERTSTTVVNAYLLTVMRTYLSRLKTALKERGFDAPLLIVNSAGGMMGVDAAMSRPVFAVGSGPAGGVTGAARLADAIGLNTVIAFDMGGTTAKASIVQDGVPMLINEYEFRDGISSPSRFTKGGGYMLKVPAIDIAEVGAGGGSIAWIDAGGMLQVGPVSAGADPGPAAYGRGSDKPTVTDANICLGLIAATGLAGGSLVIDRLLAEKAVQTYIAEPLGLTVTEAALGIRQVANINMARAIRSVTIERGLDPRDMTLMAFGGGGAVHAADVARILGIKKIIVPTMSGVFCSVGMLASDVEHSMVAAAAGSLTTFARDAFKSITNTLEEQMRDRLRNEGYGQENSILEYFADLRYVGQSSELTIPINVDDVLTGGVHSLSEPFNQSYETVYGYRDDAEVELANLRVIGRGLRDRKLEFKHLKNQAKTDSEVGMTIRDVCFQSADEVFPTTICSRDIVLTKAIPGPAILVSYDTTIVVPPGTVATTDGCGSVVLEESEPTSEVRP
jgi:N-methylhydantoinase A